MGRRVVVGMFTLVAACSPGSPDGADAYVSPQGTDGGLDLADGAQSGSRLKLTWYQFTDGTRQWSGMYDAQNKELCSPYYGAWADGKYYCTPQSGGDLVYTNATCTTKALHYYVDSVCPQAPAKYYLDYEPVGCTSVPSHIYLRGSQISAASYYYKNSNGTCSTANPTFSYDTFYTFGSEVAKSDLVELTLSAPKGSGRLGVRYYQSADGMQFPSVLHDTTIDADCSASYYSDASTAARCVPNDARYAYYAHDATCASPELALTSTCTTPKYAYTFPSTSCPDDTETYYAVSAQAMSTPLFYPSGGSCFSTTASSGTSYWMLGAAVSTAPMTYAADTGTAHRIQLIHYTTPEGTRFRDPSKLYDSQMGTDCYPETLPDGTIRCVAYGGYIYSYFTSSACTTPIDVVEIYNGPTSCTPGVVPKYARKDIAPEPGTCTYGTEVHAIGAVHAGAVYEGSPGSCSVYTPYESTLYNVGPVVPLTDFVGAALAQDN
jgi:hypothetical protein